MSDVAKVVKHLFEMYELAEEAELQDWLDEAVHAEGITDDTKQELREAASVARGDHSQFGVGA